MYESVNGVSTPSDNGLSPIRPQATIWTNAGLLSNGPLGTNFGEVLLNIQNFQSRKCIGKYHLRNGGYFIQEEVSQKGPPGSQIGDYYTDTLLANSLGKKSNGTLPSNEFQWFEKLYYASNIVTLMPYVITAQYIVEGNQQVWSLNTLSSNSHSNIILSYHVHNMLHGDLWKNTDPRQTRQLTSRSQIILKAIFNINTPIPDIYQQKYSSQIL